MRPRCLFMSRTFTSVCFECLHVYVMALRVVYTMKTYLCHLLPGVHSYQIGIRKASKSQRTFYVSSGRSTYAMPGLQFNNPDVASTLFLVLSIYVAMSSSDTLIAFCNERSTTIPSLAFSSAFLRSLDLYPPFSHQHTQSGGDIPMQDNRGAAHPNLDLRQLPTSFPSGQKI